MKKCEHFKDLILTDYIDGELDKNAQNCLESHLLDCGDCRAFLKEVKNNATLTLTKGSIQPVPAELWDSICEDLDRENQMQSPIKNFMDQLKSLIVFPKLVPAFVCLAVMFIVGSVTLNITRIHQAQDRDHGEYLISLLSSTSTTAQGDNNDSGTPIEHYFL